MTTASRSNATTMAAIWRRLQLFTAGTTPARRFQEEADTGVAAVLMCYRNLRHEPANAERENGDLFEQAVKTMEKKKFEQQKLFVQQQVTKQITTQFEALLKIPQQQQQTPKLSVSGLAVESEADHSATLDVKDWVRELLGYSLTVEKSSIDGAGEGVKLNGHVPIGSVVALFPGTVYVPEHLKKPQYLREISDNVYARARFDSVIIDAKHESSTQRNPLAVAHKINHPPAGSKPNVMPFAFDFPPDDPFTGPEFQRLIPNSFVEMPSRLSMFGKRALVHGLTFISTADIEDGEELFLNYRYNPNNTLPDWYTPVDVEADRNMWQ